MTEQTEPKKRRDRSPSYPAIPLNVVVDKVRDLYRQEKAYPTPIETILIHWKYSPKSGSGAVAVAAALKFGLLDDEGSGSTRRAKVSELGLRIVRDERDESPERERLLREAALQPAIHRELWEKYNGSLPSDANLRHSLKFEYGFTDVGAQEFAREFRATIAYARLEATDDAEPADAADYPALAEHAASSGRLPVVREAVDSVRVYDDVRPLSARIVRSLPASADIVLPLPIAGTAPDRWPSLHLFERLSEADWQQVLVVLNAMKPAILAPVEARAEAATGSGQAFDAAVKTEDGSDADG